MAKRTKRLTSQGEEKEEIRINKFLSEAGVCSRREADRYILEGKVKIDGVIAEMGSKVTKDSEITFFDKPVKREEKLVLIAFNKPEGIVSTTDRNEPDNIIDYINYGMRIYPIGRLDKDSEGLILLTNDGNIVNKILRAENRHEKEYIVTVNKEITIDFIKSMSSGVPILDTLTNPCTVTQIDKYTFGIILTQGLNRQIRRMCECLGYKVTNLRRIRIMNIQLGRLKTGDFRNVTEKEIEELNSSFELQKSRKTTEKSERNRNTTEKFESSELHRHTISSQDKRANKDANKPSATSKSDRSKTEGRKAEGRITEGRKIEGRKAQDRKIDSRKTENRKVEGRKTESRKAEGKKTEERKIEGRIAEDRKREDKDPQNKTSYRRGYDDRKSPDRNIRDDSIRIKSDRSSHDRSNNDRDGRSKSINRQSIKDTGNSGRSKISTPQRNSTYGNRRTGKAK